MSEVYIEVEGPMRWHLDVALKRFEREVAKDGVLARFKARMYHTPRSKLRARRKAIKRAKSRKNAEAARTADSVTVREMNYVSQGGYET